MLKALLVVFVVLKLVGTIHWPWIWVLAPFWMPYAVAAVIAALVYVLDKVLP